VKDKYPLVREKKVERSILDTRRKDIPYEIPLTYDQKYSKSLTDLSNSANYSIYDNFKNKTKTTQRNYPKIQYDKKRHSNGLYSDKYTFDGRPKYTSLRNSTSLSDNKSYTTLPITKTLIHSRPWTPGKVNTNYYTNTRALLSKSAKK
jgi:hypothetical protein